MSDAAAVDVIRAHSRRWIERFVVGLQLCPFAAPVLRDNQLRIAVCEATELPELASAVLDEFDILQRTPEKELATSVLVFSRALADFDDYLDFLAFAEELLAECGLEGTFQIASFHPDYRFEGAPADDIANFTNRSPYPMLHFLREDQVGRLLERYPDPDLIPERNIDRLRSLGPAALSALLAEISAPDRAKDPSDR